MHEALICTDDDEVIAAIEAARGQLEDYAALVDEVLAQIIPPPGASNH